MKQYSLALILLAALLIAGCAQISFAQEPDLRTLIAMSSLGGSVTEPGESLFKYEVATIVDIVATPEQYHAFTEWTGDAVVAGVVEDPNSAATRIIMSINCSVMANFERTAGSPFPFHEDFESATLGSFWTKSSTGAGRIQTSTEHDPHEGDYHLLMDSQTDATYSLNELTLIVNLSGQSGVSLDFYHKRLKDEPHPMPASFTGSVNADGVAVSEDGDTWYRAIENLDGPSGSYEHYQIDLDAVCAANGIGYSSIFSIKFQQYDDYPIDSDGYGFDSITVSTGGYVPEIVTDADSVIVPEAGTVSFGVKLNGEPPEQVTVSVAPADGDSDILVQSGSTLTFNSSDWDTYKTVTLYANEDPDIYDGSASVKCTAEGWKSKSITATELDNDEYAFASFPFHEDFESGALEDYWSADSTGAGRIRVSADHGPNGGGYHVLMDSETEGVDSLNELVLTIDLSARSNVELDFYRKRFDDEFHFMPASFTGSVNADGVAISADGATWYRATALTGQSDFYKKYTVDLDALCTANGIEYNAAFKIKFQQYDNSPITSDGFAFDDISVISSGGDVAGFPFSEGFESGKLAKYWSTSSTAEGRIRVATFNLPHNGDYHLLMDSATDETYSLNELVLTIDLSDRADVVLGFYHKRFADEPHPMPSSFTGSVDADGIAVSEDGVTWYKAIDGLSGPTGSYERYEIDLDAICSSKGISCNSSFKIKFQQYDDYRIDADGCAFDDITVESSGNRVAGFPFSEDFESGTLANYWSTNSTESGRISVSADNGPNEGSYHLLMDGAEDATYSLNELVLTINLSARSNVALEFYNKRFADETHLMPSSFMGSINADGVAVSEDGVTWHSAIENLSGTSDTYLPYVVDLDAVCTAANISYSSAFKIKFQQYDDYPIDSDGHAFDDITVRSSGDDIAAFPFSEDFESGSLANYWTANSTETGRIRVSADHVPNAGTYHLLMDSDTEGTYSLNEIILTIDLSGQSDVGLDFYHKRFADESHTMPSSFTGSVDADGVAVSEDGLTWHRAIDTLGGSSGSYEHYQIDLDVVCALAGISYNSSFMVKFQQYDDYSVSSDGYAFDDINLNVFAGDQYILTTSSTAGGSVSDPGEGSFVYDTDEMVTIEAVAEHGYDFTAWTGTGVDAGKVDNPTSASTTITMDDDYTVRANFEGITAADFPFYEDFESGALGDHWRTGSTEAGRIRVSIDHLPHGGTYHLLMDTDTDATYSLNEIILTVDLAGRSDVGLDFYHKRFADELNSMPSSFTGSVDADGVAVSEDGVTWHRAIESLQGSTGSYEHYQIDLDVVCALAGISYDSFFMIKFQQYDDYPIGSDGYAFDDVTLDTLITDQCILTTSSTAGGAVTNPGEASYVYDIHEVVTIEAVAEQGYKFTAWTGTGVDAGKVAHPESESTTITMDADYAVQANFEEIVAADFPFYEDFESGALADYWTASSTAAGRIRVSTDHDPNEGSYHLLMDSGTEYEYSLNELVLTIDLSGRSGVWLEFYHRNFNDESHPMPASFPGSVDADGVAVSEDGLTWYSAIDTLGGPTGSYENRRIDLDAVCASNGISYSPFFMVKFQQYDDCHITTDGFGFDNITLFTSAACPFTEDFESGDLGDYWRTNSTAAGRILVSADHDPHGGTYHLLMDSETEDTFSLNELILTINLSDQSNLMLEFYHKRFADELHEMPESFEGSVDADGVAVSADGVTWYRALENLHGETDQYTRYEVDLDALCAANGISYNSAFKIKFQQYDDYPIDPDGYAFDDINLARQAGPVSVSKLFWWNTSTGEVKYWKLNSDGSFNSEGVIGTTDKEYAARLDINGDGTTDLLFQDGSTGVVTFWLLNPDGTINSSGNMATVPTSYFGGSSGDLNGDGYDDLLIGDASTSLVNYWLLNPNGSVSASGTIGAPIVNWRISGMDDLNQDGTDDIVWQQTNWYGINYVAYWLLNPDCTRKAAGTIGKPLSGDWVLRKVRDINGDDVPDFIWQDWRNGRVAYWMMNANLTRKSAGTIGKAVTYYWYIVGVGDINADGIGDLIWWNYSTGSVAYWLLNPNGSRAASGSIGSEPDTNWQLLEVGR